MSYPVMLNLEGQPVLVVGGGKVAERKVEGLLEAKADVTVVSPELTEQLKRWANAGRFTWSERTFTAGDERDVRLVFAATDKREVNKAVYEAAKSSAFVCTVDHPEESTFTVPAVMRRDPLVISISTGGASPIVARKIKQELYEKFDDTYADYLMFLKQARHVIKEQVADEKRRRALFAELVTDDYYERYCTEGKKVCLKDVERFIQGEG
ncbi:bifunctional precorrin-2 dehydrogenase/sirohydrochlorin ferrochelatase [Bacillus tianshenii]|nr:bifunctional precorrin-2 dehydrogenase/sirohydrochlorin ferrochelatase [Bacillus tianshenii]